MTFLITESTPIAIDSGFSLSMDGLATSRIPLLLLAEVQNKRVRGEELDSLTAATFI